MNRNNWLRLAGAGVGLALLAWFLWSTDRDALAVALRSKAQLVPLCLLVEMARIAAETEATRSVLGEDRVKVAWWRLFAVHLVGFAFAMVVPAPRPASEAAKGSILAPALGVTRCVHLGVVMQTATWFAVALACLTCAAFTPARLLSRLLVANFVLLLSLAFALRGLLRSQRLADWLVRRLPKHREGIELFHSTAREGRIAGATAWMLASLFAQAFLFAVLLDGHTSASMVTAASTAGGAHLISATIGVLVPGQLGVREIAFAQIASVLDTDVAEAAALSLVPRGVQLAVAVAGFIVLAVMRSRAPVAETAVQPAQQSSV